MKNQGSGILVLSPEIWVGASTPYDKPFMTAFMQMVSVNAWDAQSKTRWFPVSYLSHVKQLIREHKLTTDGHLDNAHALILSELSRRTALKRATNVDGEVDAGLTAAYELLGLCAKTASRTLVEWAILLARKEGNSLGSPTTLLLRQEEAYRQICAGGQT